MRNIGARLFDIIFISLSFLLLSPLWVLNSCMALLSGVHPLKKLYTHDCLGRSITLKTWRSGFCKNSAALLDIFSGRLALIGIPIHFGENSQSYSRSLHDIPSGLFSRYDAALHSGYINESFESSLDYQNENHSFFTHAAIILQSLLCRILYKDKSLKTVDKFSLFGVNIDNVSHYQAVKAICHPVKNSSQVGYFINVNSLNLAYDSDSFRDTLNKSDFNFADGSGVRLGAKKHNIQLQDNNNGTDLLPLICQELCSSGKAVYFLGAAPGVAQKAADNLKKIFPDLLIAGVDHGYFNSEDEEQVIKRINRSVASVVLIAMGSPVQESWIERNRSALNVETLLAVGGLFDFYSGNIPRSPEWMRKLGLEWLYRLWQEPVKKFRRYVLGNPLFMWRLHKY